MVQVLAEGFRTASKPHQCFHCYRSIPIGERHEFQTCKYDVIYTLRFHVDCRKMAAEYHDLAGTYYDDDGWGPLRDELCDSGEYEAELDLWRGFYPHVVCRMELTDQLRAGVTP